MLSVSARYDPETDTASITTDRCPYRGQNLDYARYLLTALYHESWRQEDWELKQEADLESFQVRYRQFFLTVPVQHCTVPGTCYRYLKEIHR